MRSSFLGLGIGLVWRHRADLFPARGQFPKLARPVHHHHRLARRAGRRRVGTFPVQTTLSVPALMGAIMSLGVATANSVLVVTFAREQSAAGARPAARRLEAGVGRIRPVLMTALAMIIGMLPMSLGLGEGGETECATGPGRHRRAWCRRRRRRRRKSHRAFCADRFQLHAQQAAIAPKSNGHKNQSKF